MSGPGRPALNLNGAANTQQAGYRIQHQVPVNNINRTPIYVGNTAVGYKKDLHTAGPTPVYGSTTQAGFQQHKQYPAVVRSQFPGGGMQPSLPQHPVPRSRMMITSPQPGIIHFQPFYSVITYSFLYISLIITYFSASDTDSFFFSSKFGDPDPPENLVI